MVPEEKFDVIETGSCGNRKWKLSFCQRIRKCGKPGSQMKVFPVPETDARNGSAVHRHRALFRRDGEGLEWVEDCVHCKAELCH